jgi:hypothetical protein
MDRHPLMRHTAVQANTSTLAAVQEDTMYMAVVVATVRARRRLATMMSTAAAIGVLMSPCVAFGQAQSMTLDAITDANARASIRATIAGAKGKGVPEEPLMSKVREGVAKGSNPTLIHDAVRKLATNLERAQRALAPVQGVDELSAGAGALRAGVPDDMLRGLRASWPNRTLTVPLGVLTELVANDIPATRAAERVRELMVRGASSAQIVALGDDVRADIAAGHAPDASMELRTKGVLSLLDIQAAAAAGAATDFTSRTPRRPIRPPR